MARLDLARERLGAALESLEKAARTRAGSDKSAQDAKVRLALLEQERQELLARVAELEEELASLTGVTTEIEGRLDGAIGEIRAALART